MEIFERNIDQILGDLKSLDFDIRRQAIRDLAISDYEDKVFILQDMLHVEQDIQLKYEIRKTINELESLQERKASKIDENQLSNLRRAFQSSNVEVVNKAFQYAMDHRLEDFLSEMMMVENYTRDPFQRCCIIRMMHLSPHNFFRQILDFLSDEDPRVLSTAIETLEEIGNTAALASIARFAEHPHNRVQATAAKALHNLGDERAFSLFSKMIQSPYSAYRDSAAYSLCELNFDESVKLLGILLLDEVESVRAKALSGLEQMAANGVQDAIEVVDRLRKQDPYGLWADKLIDRMSQVDKEQQSELEEISRKIEQGPAARELAALYSDANELRMAAIQKLVEDNSKDENAELLIQRLKLEKDIRIIASAVLALGRAKGDPEDKKKVLMKFLNHHNDRVRANCIEALVQITEPRERTLMVTCLEDTSNRVMGNAIVALWETFKNKTEKALDELVSSPHKVCQLTAVYCIGELADWKLASSCRILLNSKYPDVQKKIEEVLYHLRDIPAFANVLKKYLMERSENDLEQD